MIDIDREEKLALVRSRLGSWRWKDGDVWYIEEETPDSFICGCLVLNGKLDGDLTGKHTLDSAYMALRDIDQGSGKLTYIGEGKHYPEHLKPYEREAQTPTDALNFVAWCEK